jgi:hypothetical protein
LSWARTSQGGVSQCRCSYTRSDCGAVDGMEGLRRNGLDRRGRVWALNTCLDVSRIVFEEVYCGMTVIGFDFVYIRLFFLVLLARRGVDR